MDFRYVVEIYAIDNGSKLSNYNRNINFKISNLTLFANKLLISFKYRDRPLTYVNYFTTN